MSGMANSLILGGGFRGVVAAQAQAKELGHDYQITLVSLGSRFIALCPTSEWREIFPPVPPTR
jgi:NADH dehydrogenase FAD-containing subunit